MCTCVDDRSVRDSERKAALMHFDTGQVSQSRRREGRGWEGGGEIKMRARGGIITPVLAIRLQDQPGVW